MNANVSEEVDYVKHYALRLKEPVEGFIRVLNDPGAMKVMQSCLGRLYRAVSTHHTSKTVDVEKDRVAYAFMTGYIEFITTPALTKAFDHEYYMSRKMSMMLGMHQLLEQRDG